MKGTPQILAFDEQDGQLVEIEEYIKGESLQEKVDARNLTYEAILYYSLELCKILDSMHSFAPPIIHRDVKPSNVIITPSGDVALLDFNAAKQFRCDGEQDTVLLGTKGYAAPEQYGFGVSSPQTDIYGFGMLLKQMVSVLIPERYELDSIIQTCTRLDPVDRYRTVRELEDALRVPAEAVVKAYEKQQGLQKDQASPEQSQKDQASPEQSQKDQASPKQSQQKQASPELSDDDAPVVRKAKTKRFYHRKKTSSSSANLKTVSYDPPWRRFLPPGFRSCRFSHVILAVPFYLLVLYLSITGSGGPYTRPGEALCNEIMVFISMMAGILVAGNYLNVQRLLPGCGSRHQAVRLISVLCWTLICIFALLVMFAIVIAFLYPSAT